MPTTARAAATATNRTRRRRGAGVEVVLAAMSVWAEASANGVTTARIHEANTAFSAGFLAELFIGTMHVLSFGDAFLAGNAEHDGGMRV